MSPDSSSAGPLDKGRPLAEDVATTRPPHSLTQHRQEPTAHAWATPFLVMGTRGRLRLVLVVQRCAFGCGCSHVHSGPVDFSAGRRKASCNRGSYMLHSLAQQAAA